MLLVETQQRVEQEKEEKRMKEKETGICEPLDTLISSKVQMGYPGIPPAVAAVIIKPEKEPEEGTKDLPIYHTEEGTSEKALVTAIFLSTDPAVISYNLKRATAERTDDDYESVGDISDTEELDSTKIAQIWCDIAKLKSDEAVIYDRLAAVAPNMTQSDLLYLVEKTPKPAPQLPTCVEEMYTHITDPQKF